MSTLGTRKAELPANAADLATPGSSVFRRLDGANMPYVDVFKNGFINGGFDWNQRNGGPYTITNAQSSIYTYDRWGLSSLGANGTLSVAPQAFGAGDLITDSTFYARVSVSGNTAVGDGCIFYQNIENVRRFAGRRVVIRGMARRNSGSGSVAVELIQNFGASGSPSANTYTYCGSFTPASVWTPFSIIVNVPSLVGKTFGTTPYTDGSALNFWLSAGSNYNARTNNLGLQTQAVDFSDLEIKEIVPGYGDQFPLFERIPREFDLIRCMRYYEIGQTWIYGNAYNGSGLLGTAFKCVPKRINPTCSIISTVQIQNVGQSTLASYSNQDILAYTSNNSGGSISCYHQFNYALSAEL